MVIQYSCDVPLDINLGFEGVVLNELATGFHDIAHQAREHVTGFQRVIHLDLQ